MTEALKLVQKKLVNVIAELSKFADKYKDQPTLAFTHFQPAQPTTVGKRATLWTQEFMMDLEDRNMFLAPLSFLVLKVLQVHRQAFWNCLKETRRPSTRSIR